MAYLNKYNVIALNQYEFRESRSRTNAICEHASKIIEAIDSKMPALSIFVDLKKAFDTVSQDRLLKILENIGEFSYWYDEEMFNIESEGKSITFADDTAIFIVRPHEEH